MTFDLFVFILDSAVRTLAQISAELIGPCTTAERDPASGTFWSPISSTINLF